MGSDFIGQDANLYTYVDNNPLRYADPYGLSKFDKLFGLPKTFWNWLHAEDGGKLIKDFKDKTGNVSSDLAKDYHKTWEEIGKPNPRKDSGFVDPDLLNWLVPWWLTPLEIGCGPGELCDSQPPPSCKQ